jgi:hypothetical protein
MEIKGKIIVKDFLTVDDLEVGETFAFLNSDILYLKIDDYARVIDLANAVVYELDEFDDCRPVRRIKATLFIEDKEE